jgi:hypothetical protein
MHFGWILLRVQEISRLEDDYVRSIYDFDKRKMKSTGISFSYTPKAMHYLYDTYPDVKNNLTD